MSKADIKGMVPGWTDPAGDGNTARRAAEEKIKFASRRRAVI